MPAGANRRVYALLIGIDRYRVVRPLQGCVNDTRHAAEFLRQRLGTRLAERRLFNEDATRDAIAEAIRSHLSQAGPGDAALLWFSGHGSEQPVAPEYWHVEPTGMSQTLVCHDSRDNGVPDMTDKELSLLLDRVADRSAHVIAVLDCCHSGERASATSGSAPGQYPPQQAYRTPPPICLNCRNSPYEARRARSRLQCGPATLPCQHVNPTSWPPGSRSVASPAACSAPRCLMSYSTWGPEQPRDLLLAARGRVENLRTAQTPVLYPAHRGSIADQPHSAAHSSCLPQ